MTPLLWRDLEIWDWAPVCDELSPYKARPTNNQRSKAAVKETNVLSKNIHWVRSVELPYYGIIVFLVDHLRLCKGLRVLQLWSETDLSDPNKVQEGNYSYSHFEKSP